MTEPDGRRPWSTGGGPALAIIVLAALPLLSRAALLGGTAGATWPELVAVPVWLAALLAPREAWARAGRGLWPALLLYGAGVTGGVAIVLLRDHRLASPVFAANLFDAAGRWFGAWSTADAMFPLRSAAIYLAGPLFFLAVRAIWREGVRQRLVEDLMIGGGALAALVAIAQAASGRDLSYDSIPGAALIGRAPGPLPDPNALASYLALVTAFGAVVWARRLRGAGAVERRRQAAMAAGWGALALAVLLVGMVAAATMRGVGSVPEQSRLHRLLSAFDLGQPSMTLLRGRPALWAAGATMILDEPVAGVGAGRFGVELAPRLPAELWGVATAENAHNYYLQAAAEIGSIGVIGLLLLLAAAFGALWRQRHQPLRRAALYGAGAWCITCLAGHPQLVPSLQLFFWGFLGVATAGLPLPRTAPRLSLLLIPVALLAGRVGQEVVAGAGGPAFYAAGLHEREPTAPGREITRWTSGRTDLEVRRAGNVVELRFLLVQESTPVTVRTGVGGWREERHFFAGGWKSLRYYLPQDTPASVDVTVGVTPLLLVPDDTRDLGVVLAPLHWQDGPLREPVGTYAAETGADGRRFRWTAGVACLPLGGSGDVEIELRADNPDLADHPLQVTLRRGDAPPQLATLADREWRRVKVPAAGADADVLCLQSSRTWNPRLAAGTGDGRDLGVAVALPSAAANVVGGIR